MGGGSYSYGHYGGSELYDNINISEASNSPIRPKRNPQIQRHAAVWDYEPREFIQRVESEKKKKDKSSEQSSSQAQQSQSSNKDSGSQNNGQKDQSTPPNNPNNPGNPNNRNDLNINWEEYGDDYI